MSPRTNAILNIGLIAGALLLLTVFSITKEDRKFSENENRLLGQRPKLAIETVLSGKFAEAYEEYVTDQFVGRDAFITVKTYGDILLGKKDIKGIYLGKDGYLLTKQLPDSFTEKEEEKRLMLLENLAQYCDKRQGEGTFRVLLAPTSDNVLKDKLPAFAPVYDQSVFLNKVKACISDKDYVDVQDIMSGHRDEYIYYRTDHHWTTLGAYYAYEEWAESMGFSPIPQEEFTIRMVSGSFLGTLHSKLNIWVKPDEMYVYEPKDDVEYQVYYDLSKTPHTSLYEEKYLETKNKYGMFLDDNHGLVEIDTSVGNGKTLLVIKDSYANCFIPFVALHYEKLYVLDLRYYKSKLFDMIEDDMDVLVLYNVYHFIEEFQYY